MPHCAAQDPSTYRVTRKFAVIIVFNLKTTDLAAIGKVPRPETFGNRPPSSERIATRVKLWSLGSSRALPTELHPLGLPASTLEGPRRILTAQHSRPCSAAPSKWSEWRDSNPRYSCSQSRRHTRLGDTRIKPTEHQPGGWRSGNHPQPAPPFPTFTPTYSNARGRHGAAGDPQTAPPRPFSSLFMRSHFVTSNHSITGYAPVPLTSPTQCQAQPGRPYGVPASVSQQTRRPFRFTVIPTARSLRSWPLSAATRFHPLRANPTTGGCGRSRTFTLSSRLRFYRPGRLKPLFASHPKNFTTNFWHGRRDSNPRPRV